MVLYVIVNKCFQCNIIIIICYAIYYRSLESLIKLCRKSLVQDRKICNIGVQKFVTRLRNNILTRFKMFRAPLIKLFLMAYRQRQYNIAV